MPPPDYTPLGEVLSGEPLAGQPFIPALPLLWQIDQVDQRVDQRFLTTQNFPGGFPAVRGLSLHNKSTQQVSGKVITSRSHNKS